jgi:antitoxin component of RelBE/YafQ-DinJ toxin-antitoxin module
MEPKTVIQVRVAPKMRDELQRLADELDMSLSEFVRVTLQGWLARKQYEEEK